MNYIGSLLITIGISLLILMTTFPYGIPVVGFVFTYIPYRKTGKIWLGPLALLVIIIIIFFLLFINPILEGSRVRDIFDFKNNYESIGYFIIYTLTFVFSVISSAFIKIKKIYFTKNS